MNTKQQKIELNAFKRETIGGRLASLRKSGLVPAILYGKNQEPFPLQVPIKDFIKVLGSAGESTLIYINVDGQSYPIIINDVAKDPVSDEIIHADFYKVRLDQKIRANVSVEFSGISPAVKDNGGIFIRNINELEVEGLPQDLPHEITIDISNMKNFGDQILIKDIKLDPGLKIIVEDVESIVATVQEPMSEEELEKALEAPTETAEDVKVIEKEKEEEVPDEEDAETPASSQEESAENKS